MIHSSLLRNPKVCLPISKATGSVKLAAENLTGVAMNDMPITRPIQKIAIA